MMPYPATAAPHLAQSAPTPLPIPKKQKCRPTCTHDAGGSCMRAGTPRPQPTHPCVHTRTIRHADACTASRSRGPPNHTWARALTRPRPHTGISQLSRHSNQDPAGPSRSRLKPAAGAAAPGPVMQAPSWLPHGTAGKPGRLQVRCTQPLVAWPPAARSVLHPRMPGDPLVLAPHFCAPKSWPTIATTCSQHAGRRSLLRPRNRLKSMLHVTRRSMRCWR
jgi:hypothetical protein